jgi:hypothetical protein
VPQQLPGDLGALLFRQFLEHILVGAGRLGLAGVLDGLVSELAEEDGAQLGGAVQVEGLASEFEHPCFCALALAVHSHGELGKDGQIEPHTMAFQGGQYFHQGQVHFFIEEVQLVIRELRPQVVAKPQGQVGIFCGVLHGMFELGFVETFLALALPNHLFEGDGFHIQQAHGKVVQVVADATFQQKAQYHAVVRQPGHRQVVTGQHLEIVLEVLAALPDGSIRE